jgi:hypothetical protein
MPISPAQAKKKREDDKQFEYVLACDQIDKGLVEDDRPEHWVAASLIPEGCHERFVRDYEVAGWNVRRVSDQRDGDAYVLSPRGRR